MEVSKQALLHQPSKLQRAAALLQLLAERSTSLHSAALARHVDWSHSKGSQHAMAAFHTLQLLLLVVLQLQLLLLLLDYTSTFCSRDSSTNIGCIAAVLRTTAALDAHC
jgi:hypothetical protein